MRMYFKSIAVIASILATQTISAGVTISGTRIVFPSNQKTVTVQLNNPSDNPALVQAWLDDGDADDIPHANKIPFILTPPLSKVEAHKGQMLRVISAGSEKLPKDRESLFWFNILDIPSHEISSAQPDDANKLQVAVRSRIKLFYRPQQLKMSQQKAFASLKFEYSASKQTILVTNPSAYFISFWDLSLNPEQENSPYTETLMLAPFSSESFKPSKKLTPHQVKYTLINDFGGNEIFKASITSIE